MCSTRSRNWLAACSVNPIPQNMNNLNFIVLCTGVGVAFCGECVSVCVCVCVCVCVWVCVCVCVCV